MSEMMPKVRIASLKRLTKKDGSGSYFIGSLGGGTKVLMFQDKKAEGEAEVWSLLVQEQSDEDRRKYEAWKADRAQAGKGEKS